VDRLHETGKLLMEACELVAQNRYAQEDLGIRKFAHSLSDLKLVGICAKLAATHVSTLMTMAFTGNLMNESAGKVSETIEGLGDLKEEINGFAQEFADLGLRSNSDSIKRGESLALECLKFPFIEAFQKGVKSGACAEAMGPYHDTNGRMMGVDESTIHRMRRMDKIQTVAEVYWILISVGFRLTNGSDATELHAGFVDDFLVATTKLDEAISRVTQILDVHLKIVDLGPIMFAPDDGRHHPLIQLTFAVQRSTR